MSALVVCLGNELIGDDGVGIRVGAALRGLPLPEGTEVMVRPNLGLELIDLLAEHERVILVDAMTTGRAPGTCAVLEVEGAVGMASCPSCSHSIGIPEVLQIASRLEPERPLGAVRIIGVEGQSMDRFGVGLSPPVRAGMVEAVDRVLEAIGAGDEVRELGRRAARAEAEATRTLTDVLDTR